MRLTVKYVNTPLKPDAKFGNIKTTEDMTIMVPIQKLGLFQRGMVCDLATEQRTWGSGADARPVTVAVGSPVNLGGANQLGVPVPDYTAQQGYIRTNAPDGQYEPVGEQMPGTGNMAHPGQSSPSEGKYVNPRANPDARGIFATGIVGRAMGSGKFTASEVDVLLEAALAAYDKHFTPP